MPTKERKLEVLNRAYSGYCRQCCRLGNFFALREWNFYYSIYHLFFRDGLPLLYIEWTLERLGTKYNTRSTSFTMRNLARGGLWKYMGALSITTNIIIVAFYCYIESWIVFLSDIFIDRHPFQV